MKNKELEQKIIKINEEIKVIEEEIKKHRDVNSEEVNLWDLNDKILKLRVQRDTLLIREANTNELYIDFLLLSARERYDDVFSDTKDLEDIIHDMGDQLNKYEAEIKTLQKVVDDLLREKLEGDMGRKLNKYELEIQELHEEKEDLEIEAREFLYQDELNLNKIKELEKEIKELKGDKNGR